MFRFRSVVALMSLALAGTVLGLTLGLWEHSLTLIDQLRDVVGRYTWEISLESQEGLQPPPLPSSGSAFAALQSLPGVQAVGVETGISQPIGTFSYASSGVNADFFGVRRYALSAGRVFGSGQDTEQEAVVGSELGNLLGQTVEVSGLGTVEYRVVGVLEPLVERDTFANSAVYVPIDSYPGFSGAQNLYVEVSPANFAATRAALTAWLADNGLSGYKLAPLAERYGLELREKVARLLSGGLLFGAVAAFLAAGANLVTFYLARALERIRFFGLRRAVGANAGTVVREEVEGALPWALVGVALSLPGIYLGNRWLERAAGLSALPGGVTFVGLALGLLLLVGLSALYPALWAARWTPAYAIRGLASSAAQRRVWLAGAGLALGVAGLILQASTAEAAQREAQRVLGSFDSRTAVVGSFSPEANLGDPRANASLSTGDYRAFLASPLADAFTRSSYARGFLVVDLRGSVGSSLSSVIAYDGDYPELVGVTLIGGRLPDPEKAELLLGVDVATNLFGTQALGQTLNILGQDWVVVGVFEAGTQGIPGGASNQKVLLPGKLVRAKGDINFMVAERAATEPDERFDEAAAFFNARHASAQTLPFLALRPSSFAPPELSRTLSTLSTVYRALSVLLLALGGVGFMAQLLVSVSLRVREIGIRRATGASRGDIFRQFLREVLGLGLSATALGLLLGGVAAFLSARVQGVAFSFPFGWAVGAAALGVVLSFIFGAGPSWAAARIPPASAMRRRPA